MPYRQLRVRVRASCRGLVPSWAAVRISRPSEARNSSTIGGQAEAEAEAEADAEAEAEVEGVLG